MESGQNMSIVPELRIEPSMESTKNDGRNGVGNERGDIKKAPFEPRCQANKLSRWEEG